MTLIAEWIRTLPPLRLAVLALLAAFTAGAGGSAAAARFVGLPEEHARLVDRVDSVERRVLAVEQAARNQLWVVQQIDDRVERLLCMTMAEKEGRSWEACIR